MKFLKRRHYVNTIKKTLMQISNFSLLTTFINAYWNKNFRKCAHTFFAPQQMFDSKIQYDSNIKPPWTRGILHWELRPSKKKVFGGLCLLFFIVACTTLPVASTSFGCWNATCSCTPGLKRLSDLLLLHRLFGTLLFTCDQTLSSAWVPTQRMCAKTTHATTTPTPPSPTPQPIRAWYEQ